MSDSPPWGDTPFPDLNFAADCAVSGRYVASLLTGLDEPSVSTVTDFFRAAAPDRPSDFNDGTAAEWHRFVADNNLDRDLRYIDVLECLPQLCTSVTRSLPNDVIGIGMLVAVALEMLLVVGYCGAALAAWRSKAPPGEGSRVVQAFRATANQFFLLAALLCSGVSVAVIYDGAMAISGSTGNTYYGTGCLLMGAVYFPLAATLPVYLWSSRRQWLDGAVLAVAWILASAAIIVVPESSRTGGTLREFCPRESVSRRIMYPAGQALHGVATWCPVLLGVVLLLIIPCFKCSGRRMWESVGQLRAMMPSFRLIQSTVRWLVIIYAVLGFVGTISYGILLLIFAGRSTWVMGSWGLGQGLALVLWLPLLYEFVHVAEVGIDRGLEVRLPKGFRVERRDEEPEVVPDPFEDMRGGPAAERGTELDRLDDVRLPSAVVPPGKVSMASSTGPPAYA